MIGETLHKKYLVMKRLGGGDKNALYQAKDQQSNTIVTLSQFSYSQNADQPGDERFRKITSALRGLNNPHIHAFSDFFVEGGYLYAVSAALPGNLLTENLKQGQMPVADSVNILRQILKGLTYIHEKKVQHLDLKPDNICLAPDGKVSILNAGVSKLLEGVFNESETMVVGSPEYLAPEQIEPELFQEPELGVTDIYAAGMVLYHLLAGEPAFKGSTHLEVLMKQLKDAPPLLYLVDDSFRSFDTLLGKALAKQPEKRFPSSNEFLQALTQAENGWKSAVSSANDMSVAEKTESTMRLPMDFVNEVTQTNIPARTRRAAAQKPSDELPALPDVELPKDETRVLSADEMNKHLQGAEMESPTPKKAQVPPPRPGASATGKPVATPSADAAPATAAKPAADPKAAKAEGEGGGKGPLVGILALVAIIVVGVLGYVFMSGGGSEDATTPPDTDQTASTEGQATPSKLPNNLSIFASVTSVDANIPFTVQIDESDLPTDSELKLVVSPESGFEKMGEDFDRFTVVFREPGSKSIEIEAYQGNDLIARSNRAQVEINEPPAPISSVDRDADEPPAADAATASTTADEPAPVEDRVADTPKPRDVPKKREPTPAVAKAETPAKKPAEKPPTTSEPAVAKSNATKPPATKPSATEQPATKPTTTRPAETKPAEPKPAVAKTTPTKPSTSGPSATEPEPQATAKLNQPKPDPVKPEPRVAPKPEATVAKAETPTPRQTKPAVAKKPEPKPQPKPKPEKKPQVAKSSADRDEPELPAARGIVGYQVVVRDEDGNFIPGTRVTFNWSGNSKSVRSNSRGVAEVKLPAQRAVKFNVQGTAGEFRNSYRVNFTLRKKDHPISFKVRINGQETTEGSIIISQEGTRFKKVTQPGNTEDLLAGTYFFTYQSKTLSHSETYTVKRRNVFAFDISTDPNVYYRDLYFKKNDAALKAAVQKEIDPVKGYDFFMPRYWLAQLRIDEENTARAAELLGQLYEHAGKWERMAIKPNYILDYLRCLSTGESPDYPMIARICRNSEVLKQFQTLSTGRKESNWKFLFFYYRITAFYELSEERSGAQKRATMRQAKKTYDWLEEIPAEVLNSNPDKYGRLREIKQKMAAATN
ncbi:Non-specific serine/threonine protein kinase [Sulfidibacter corallicola]|uniref:Protein kinase n=1 Tax=Sulfidibacter corallicola TaxID=2818388 RepID=A0A8A4TXU0_SULCO|nr:protein kinase [Sulfidibacter corallicola]QTD54018.1 protein kinase [Sulfidibacter corallicola]